jgi:hypothetical protein
MAAPVFSSKFRRQKAPDGRIQYWFESCYPLTADEHPISVEGENIPSEIVQENFMMPDEIYNPQVSRRVFETWITDCSGAFVKSPTIEQCLANVTPLWDSNAPIAKVDASEQEDSWIYMWTPTKIKVEMPHFQIYWAPSYKSKLTRIPEMNEPDTVSSDYTDVMLDSPERTYTVAADGTRIIMPRNVLQEVQDSALPLLDSPDLRLSMELNVAQQAQRDKFRRRVREARIRAKLSRYRAERLAERFEERFGEYPEEDDEEAQTEVEGSEED